MRSFYTFSQKYGFILLGKKQSQFLSVFCLWHDFRLPCFNSELNRWSEEIYEHLVSFWWFFSSLSFFLFSIVLCVVEQGKTYANRLFKQIKGQKQCKTTTSTQWTNESLSSISCVCLMIVCAPAHIKFSMNLQSKDGKKERCERSNTEEKLCR